MEQLDWTWIFEHALAWSCGDPDYADWYLTDQADATSYQDLQSHPLAWQRYLDDHPTIHPAPQGGDT